MDILTALGRFTAQTINSTRPWLPLTDSGIDGVAMGALLAHGLAERDGERAVYRLTAKGRHEAEDLEGLGHFGLDPLLGSARSTCQPDASRDDVARTAVLLTSDDDLRSALRAAVCEILAFEDGAAARVQNRPTTGRGADEDDDDNHDEPGDGFAGFELFRRTRGRTATSPMGRGEAPLAPAPAASRWERAGDALRSQGMVITTGPTASKVLADCTADDLRAASAYYVGIAMDNARRSRLCDALLEAMTTYEAATVAELEAAAPERVKELLA